MPIYKTGIKNKDGVNQYKVRVNYTDTKGSHRSFTRMIYGLAEAKDLEAILANQKLNQTTKLTITQLSKEYETFKKYEIRETTLLKNMSIVKSHILPILGDTDLSKLTAKVLVNWKNVINEKEIGFVMKKNIYAALRGLLNYAVKMEYIHSNPLIRVGNFKNAYQEEKKIQYYTAEEFKLYIEEAKSVAIKRDFYDYYIFFCIAYYTGARKGEINALTWNDISGNELSITKSVSQKTKGADVITPPKNKSSNRTLQLPKNLMAILEDHYERCKRYKGFNDNFFICGGIKSLRDTSIEKENTAYAKAAGLHHIRIHDFRHSHATLLANNNINITEISRRLGHANITQTLNTYSHFYPQEEEKALKVLEVV